MMEGLSDKELILMARHGNDQAFDIIYKRYHRTLYAYTLRLLKDEDVAADIVQNVFIKLWESADLLPQEINVRAYLYSMTRNRVINYIRDDRSRLVHNYMIVSESDLVEDEDFFSALEDAARKEELEKAIESLPPQQKKVIRYRFSGKTNREIAEKENLSLNTVNVHYRLAMQKLRSILKVIPFIILFL